jgi:TPR repeat protein
VPKDVRPGRIERDYREAVRWYRLAAEQGQLEAQLNLGNILYKGLGGLPQNYAEAAKWFHLAADQGDATAQSKLGAMYDNGEGVPQDYAVAHMWFNLAAAQGDQDGAKARDQIAQRMTPAQIAEAQKLARDWKPGK